MGKVWLFRSYIALFLNLFPRYVPTSHVTGYCGIFSGSSRCSAFPEKSPEQGSENLAYVRTLRSGGFHIGCWRLAEHHH
uniref:Putative secreted protein n=1 Tax=Amblyomma triste TaxID=251400 RepID=A0A023FZS6_AMBTT